MLDSAFMKPFRLTPSVSAHLDAVRGVAALAVMVGHVRSMFFVSYPEVLTKNFPLQAVYVLTGFAHEAVVVFFVLSGLLIGPRVLEAVSRGSWSWKQYSVHRLTRLYIVLIPALLLTAGLDRIGQSLPGAQLSYESPLPGYSGWIVTQRNGLPVFLGNVFFLERITCPPFGSDAPLWSLSFEFWYYLLFPLVVLACAASQPASPAWKARAA
jgi:peptidoglycan/LPS O-acetylase OafA/YrhL